MTCLLRMEQNKEIEPNKPYWLQVLNLDHLPAVLEWDPGYLFWKWGMPPFSLQNQWLMLSPFNFFNVLYCGTWPVRTTGLLVTSLTPATETPCWVCPTSLGGPALWAGTVDDAHSSCLLLHLDVWLEQNPRWPANWTTDTAICTRETSFLLHEQQT